MDKMNDEMDIERNLRVLPYIKAKGRKDGFILLSQSLSDE